MDGIKDTIFKLLGIGNLVESISGYADARVKLLKIEIQEEVAKVLSKGMVHLFLLLIALIFLFFLSIGVAEFLNVFFVNSFQGYLILAGFYLLIFLILLIFRKDITKKFEKYFSETIKQTNENEL